MFKKLKSVSIGLMAGANVATILVMLLFGFAGYISPTSHATISSLGFLFPFAALANLLFLFIWLVFKWRMALIPFVGFLITYVPMRAYMPLNLPSSHPEGSIKLLSYNVGGYSSTPDSSDAFSEIFSYIRDSKADIVCLQEDNDTWRKSEARFDSLFAYNDLEQVNDSSSKIINRLGIHTRYPILRKERIMYKSLRNGSVAWFLQVGNDTLIVINNHLESTHLTKDDRNQYNLLVHGEVKGDTIRTESRRLLTVFSESSVKRAPATEAVHTYIEAHKGYNIVVCGDFNDHPLSYTRYTLARGMTDCFVATGNGLGVSFNRYGMYFRIDHILCSKNIQPYECKIDAKIDASDHYPLTCWLKIG